MNNEELNNDFQPDPSQDDDFNVGQGDAPEPEENDTPEPTPEPKKEEKDEDVMSTISRELSEDANPEQEGEGVATPVTPNAFDLNSLTREQIQQLKAMLNATPDTIQRKRANPKVTLRQIDGKLVIDFKSAFLGLVDDPENQRKVERHIIPVKFLGETEFANIIYSKFINSERVPCEILEVNQKVDEIVEGETISRETGTLTDMVRKEIKTSFTIKLPNGETTKIESRMANA